MSEGEPSNREFSLPPEKQATLATPEASQPEINLQGHDADCETCRYSRIMGLGIRISLLLLIVSYVVYLAGWMPNRIDAANLPQYWSLPAQQYVQQGDMPEGWQWAGQLDHGDVATILPIIIMASLSIICGLSILPIYLRRRDYGMVIIVLLQMVVMLVAALPWSAMRR